MALVNTSKPITSVTNSDKINFGETWATILTTWASETRTWAESGTLFTNTTRQSSSVTNIAKP